MWGEWGQWAVFARYRGSAEKLAKKSVRDQRGVKKSITIGRVVSEEFYSGQKKGANEVGHLD